MLTLRLTSLRPTQTGVAAKARRDITKLTHFSAGDLQRQIGGSGHASVTPGRAGSGQGRQEVIEKEKKKEKKEDKKQKKEQEEAAKQDKKKIK
jgi:hypothetical protein